MADNSTLPVASGNEVFANDDIGSVKFPRVKLTWGVDGTATDASTANPIPVKIDASQVEGGEYEDVLASATSQVLGTTGATGDYISGMLIVPETTTPGSVTLQDGTITPVFTIFVGGASSVSNLVPFWVPLGHTSVNGPLKVTTTTNIHLRAVGNFT